MSDSSTPARTDSTPSAASADRVLPVLAEELALGTDARVAGAVRVRVESDADAQQLNGEEVVEQALVQRVPRGIEVAASKPPWTEGDTLVVPLYAERVEVTRRLILTEEIRIARHALRHPVTLESAVRRERAVVERLQPDGSWREIECEAADSPHDRQGHSHSTERKQP
jgi:uncharacterized protein (TIGR02271 family)